VEGPLFSFSDVIPTAVEGPLFSFSDVIPTVVEGPLFSFSDVIPTVVEGPLFSLCHFERGARSSIDAAIAKPFPSEMATRVAHKAMEIPGGNGYSREYPSGS
jgi:hypothetical protein